MTTTQSQTTEVVDMITVVIDGFEVTVPKGTPVIRAAEKLGIQIPRFCDHPLLDPVGACRQCLVDIEINGRAFPKPQASCTIPVEPGMIVKTQLTSDVAEKAQRGVMELLLVNHPLDCPVCDKGGECPLQNQATGSNGQPLPVTCAMYSSRKYLIDEVIGLVAPSPSAQNERPIMLSHRSHT